MSEKENSPSKKLYSAPVLTTFGKVEDLTRTAGNQHATDGGGPPPRNRTGA